MDKKKRIRFRTPISRRNHVFQLGIRGMAVLIDSIILNGFFYLLSLVGFTSVTEWDSASLYSFGELNIFFIYWIYFSSFEAAVGATPGKLFMRLKVYDHSGESLPMMKAIIR